MNRVRIVLAVALVLMLSSLAMSAPESSQLGPYGITFDLNTDLGYTVTEQEPQVMESATIYLLQISTDNTTGANVIINQFNELVDATLAPQKQISIMAAAFSGYNVTSLDDIIIDGKEGYVVSAVPSSFNTMVPADLNRYEAIYWLDSAKCDCGPVSVGTTSVGITSTYPEDVTMNLINSLRIVKGEAVAAANAQVLPPA
ncbi:MAG TPA: hypothetical protein PLY52_04110 [Methanothrix sp.]|uniref:hypothetical protein n=1 Tax=Methanothrix sp. TaxID=90426 RepID=UPI002CD63921|nr:hypothetical protein [Methanothrix sp.]HON35479.1 hypothetical protein [Methanothrix sp.]HRU74540.1 hypothetical protein [Methanothrix sp.]